MLSFAEKAEILPEEIHNYCLTRDVLSYEVNKSGVKEENDELREHVSISLDKNIDRVRVRKETKYSHHFIIFADNPNCQDYLTTCHQVITEFLVRNGNLESTTVSITQVINKNTYFSGTENIVNFSSVSDFKNQSKIDSLPSNHSEIKMDIASYSIPEGYHITDGVGPIDNNPKVMEKTNQS